MNQCYITQTSNLNTCDKKTRDRLDLYTPVSLTNVNLKGTVKKLNIQEKVSNFVTVLSYCHTLGLTRVTPQPPIFSTCGFLGVK